MSRPIHGTVAEAYLHGRGITDLRTCDAVRFHPCCYCRGDKDDPADRVRDAWPALIASVRDLNGRLTGVSRTWLDPSGAGKAPVSTPRRAMGHLLGHGVRFCVADDVMAAGEGVETMLSLRQVTPDLPLVAGLSANHLAALLLPVGLRRLYLVRDDDSRISRRPWPRRAGRRRWRRRSAHRRRTSAARTYGGSSPPARTTSRRPSPCSETVEGWGVWRPSPGRAADGPKAGRVVAILAVGAALSLAVAWLAGVETRDEAGPARPPAARPLDPLRAELLRCAAAGEAALADAACRAAWAENRRRFFGRAEEQERAR